MRILLVRPPRMRQAITIGEFMFCEPIGLEAVAAVLRKDHTVRLLDMMIEKVELAAVCASWKPGAVGFTSLCIDVGNVLRLAREVKAHDPDIVTVVGGTQAHVDPEAFEDASMDHVAQFTTRANLLALFGALDAREKPPLLDGVRSRVHGYRSTGVAGRNEYIVPDIRSTAAYRGHYSYFGFKPCAILQTSQGCSACCRFCLRWRIEGPREEPQPLDIVLDQVRRLPEPNIMIFDNDFLHDGVRLNAFCDGLEKDGLRRNFLCYGSVHSLLRNREAVARFARHGLRAVLVGYESFSADELADYHKPSRPEDALTAAAFLKSIGVDAWASFMVHPDWTREDFRRLRAHIRRLRPEVASLSPLTPFPLLPLYSEYRDRLLYRREDYEQWTFGQVAIRPSRMSLRRYYWELFKANLHTNLVSNRPGYLVRKFGVGALLRILAGSLRLGRRYVVLMLRADSADA